MSAASSFASVAQLKELCQASVSFTPSQVQLGHRIAEIGKHVLLAGCEELIKNAGAQKPILTSKSADGTPVTATVGSPYKLLSGKSFRRSGRECKELLLNNQYFTWISASGEVMTRCLLQVLWHWLMEKPYSPSSKLARKIGSLFGKWTTVALP